VITTHAERLTERVQIALTPREFKRLRERAEVMDISVSDLGRRLILQGLR
jgi:hypothetical protein